jgi:hypothetical protein
MRSHIPTSLTRSLLGSLAVTTTAALAGCGPTVQVAPITIQPITITVDINIKIDKELDNFFAFQKGGSATAAATAPDSATNASATSASP